MTDIEQINYAISEMDGVTQQNATLVEEAAAASKVMENEASNLTQVISVFRFDKKPSGAIALDT